MPISTSSSWSQLLPMAASSPPHVSMGLGPGATKKVKTKEETEYQQVIVYSYIVHLMHFLHERSLSCHFAKKSEFKVSQNLKFQPKHTLQTQVFVEYSCAPTRLVLAAPSRPRLSVIPAGFFPGGAGFHGLPPGRRPVVHFHRWGGGRFPG